MDDAMRSYHYPYPHSPLHHRFIIIVLVMLYIPFLTLMDIQKG